MVECQNCFRFSWETIVSTVRVGDKADLIAEVVLISTPLWSKLVLPPSNKSSARVQIPDTEGAPPS